MKREKVSSNIRVKPPPPPTTPLFVVIRVFHLDLKSDGTYSELSFFVIFKEPNSSVILQVSVVYPVG